MSSAFALPFFLKRFGLNGKDADQKGKKCEAKSYSTDVSQGHTSHTVIEVMTSIHKDKSYKL